MRGTFAGVCPITLSGSSDVWVGNRSATLGDGSHQQFRGVEVLRAILAQGISGTVTPTEIILAGTSAGAIGAGAHVSYVQDLFPNATVLLVLDSVSPPFNIGVEHVNSRYNITDQHNSTAIFSLLEQAWGSPLESFAATATGIGREGTRSPCLFLVQCMLQSGFIPATVPTFIVQPANDVYTMESGIDYIVTGFDNGEAPRLLNIRDRFYAMLQSLKAPVQTPIRDLRKSTFPLGLFAPGCLHHGMLTPTVPNMPGLGPPSRSDGSDSGKFSWTVTVDSGTELLDFILALDVTDLWSDDGHSWTSIVVDGQTLEDALSGWVTAIRGDNRSTFIFEDGCLGLSCNPTCLEEVTFKSAYGIADTSGWIAVQYALSGVMLACSVGMMLAARWLPFVDAPAEIATASIADAAQMLVESQASRPARLMARFADNISQDEHLNVTFKAPTVATPPVDTSEHRLRLDKTGMTIQPSDVGESEKLDVAVDEAKPNVDNAGEHDANTTSRDPCYAWADEAPVMSGFVPLHPLHKSSGLGISTTAASLHMAAKRKSAHVDWDAATTPSPRRCDGAGAAAAPAPDGGVNDTGGPGASSSNTEAPSHDSGHLRVQNMSFVVPTTADGGTGKRVLQSTVYSHCRPGVTAVMGPSGAGKTTFLNVAAGKITGGELSGDVYFDDLSVYASRGGRARAQQMTGFVTQLGKPWEDTLTFRENLRYAAELRLPGATRRDKAVRVETVIAAVEGQNFAEVRTEGLSGGQKRKLSMAIQLLSEKTRFLFLDEPTSGLDATSTLRLLTLLAILGKNGYTILITIHQPRIEVWELFDDVIILAAGRMCYQGSPETAVPFLSDVVRQNNGGVFEQPKGANPADVVIDFLGNPANQKLVSTAHAATRQVRESRREIDEFCLTMSKAHLGSVQLSVRLEEAPVRRGLSRVLSLGRLMSRFDRAGSSITEPTQSLHVKLVRGSGLPAMDLCGTSHRYVCAYIMDQMGNNVEKRTAKKKIRTLFPDFEGETLAWEVHDAEQTLLQHLVVEVWDWHWFALLGGVHSDQLVGMVRFPIGAAVNASAQTPIVADLKSKVDGGRSCWAPSDKPRTVSDHVHGEYAASLGPLTRMVEQTADSLHRVYTIHRRIHHVGGIWPFSVILHVTGNAVSFLYWDAEPSMLVMGLFLVIVGVNVCWLSLVTPWMSERAMLVKIEVQEGVATTWEYCVAAFTYIAAVTVVDLWCICVPSYFILRPNAEDQRPEEFESILSAMTINTWFWVSLAMCFGISSLTPAAAMGAVNVTYGVVGLMSGVFVTRAQLDATIGSWIVDINPHYHAIAIAFTGFFTGRDHGDDRCSFDSELLNCGILNPVESSGEQLLMNFGMRSMDMRTSYLVLYLYWLASLLLLNAMARRSERVLLGKPPKWTDDRHAIDTADLTALIELQQENADLKHA